MNDIDRSVPDLAPADMAHLRRCLELAAEASAHGDGPFGSVLVDGHGNVLHEDRNRERSTGDPTAHPELALARWAATNVDAQELPAATVYTSGEHCPMCAAAHAWVGIGRIVYIASARQLTQWRTGWGAADSPVRPLAIQDVAPAVTVVGPVPELLEEIRSLHRSVARG